MPPELAHDPIEMTQRGSMLIQPKSFVGVNPAIKGYAIHPIWFVTVANLSR